MKNNAFFITIVLFLFACQNNRRKEQPAIIFNAKIESKQSNKLIVATELINNSDSTLNYLTMSCDSLIVYTTSNKSFEIIPRICESNYPVKKRLLAHSRLNRTIMLSCKRININNAALLKIGYSLFDTEEAMFNDNANRIIWSVILK